MDNAYLYGQIDCQVYIEQSTDSTGREEMPGRVCLLLKSMHSIRQTGSILKSFLVEKLVLWDFKKSTTDDRLPLLSHGTNFILLVIGVDNLGFISNSA